MKTNAEERLRSHARAVEIATLASLSALFYLIPDGATTWVLALNLGIFYLLFLRSVARPDRISALLPTYFTVEVLFFAFSYLIFYYPYQQYLLGWADLEVSRFVANTFVSGSNKAITLATVGMLAFTIGYRIVPAAVSSTTDHAVAAPVVQNRREDLPVQQFRTLASISSILLALLVGVYLAAGWRSAGEGRYTGTTTDSLGVEGFSVVILMLSMIVAALWIYALAARLRMPPVLIGGLLISIAWSGRMLVFGDRSAFLLFALVLVAGYFSFVRRSRPILILLVLGVWMFLYNIVEVVRSVPDWYSAGNFWDAWSAAQNRPGSGGDSSFNITTITLRATVETVPSLYDHTYGLLKLIQASTMVPFSAKLFIYPYVTPDYNSSADMIGDILLGRHASWNPGTNVISDAFIDFGLPGVVAILLCVGLVAKLFRNYVVHDLSDPRRVVLYLLSLALLSELPRYAIELPARTLAWTSALMLIASFLGVMSNRSTATFDHTKSGKVQAFIRR